MNNFQCNKCFHLFEIPSYRITYKNGVKVIKDLKNNLINCPNCSSYDILSLDKEGEFKVNFGRFNSMSNEDKKRVLKKRSQDHYNKNTDSLKDRKEYLEKNFTGRTKDGDF